MMTKSSRITVGCVAWILALATIFATGALAQSNGVAAATPVGTETASRTTPDMRLWSFGECDNRFPYVESEEHKECVRVVRSPEARDARAYRVCETSNSRDPEEVARCKLTYQQNKEKATQHGYVPDAPAQPQAPPTAEELRRVRAISAAALEKNREVAAEAAAANPAPVAEVAPPAAEEESGSSHTLVIALVFGVVLLGGAAIMSRRKQAEALSSR
jgi:hypothetical protein